MSVDINRALFLLQIVEKAESHTYIRAEATAQLAELDKACAMEVNKRNEVRLEEQRKAQEAIMAKQKDETDRLEKERQNEAKAERLNQDPRIRPRIAPELGTDPTPGQPRGTISPAVPEALPGETPAELSARLKAERKPEVDRASASEPETERRI